MSTALSTPSWKPTTVPWSVCALLILLPLWSFALFGRGAWMPDEPREYDIAVNMLHDGNLAVPHLAGEAFLEKPPLLYWVGASVMTLVNESILSARAQNLLWSSIVILAIGALAGRMASASGCDRPRARDAISLVAALAAGTMMLPLRIQIWFSTDAPLLAATALAWLAAWSAIHAEDSGDRMRWYLVFAGALGVAFFTKNVFGWVTPVLGLWAWIVLEKRWRVLLQPELYVALSALLAALALWAMFVLRQPQGAEALRAIVWDNTLGRFHSTASTSGYQFGHRNHPLRYLTLLPVFVLPWTFCIIAALRWAYLQLRSGGANAGAIRFAVCAFVPGVLLLAVSATARDVYYGPSVLAMCPLLGMWAQQRNADRMERICMAINTFSTRFAGVLLIAASLVLAVLQGQSPGAWRIAVGLLIAVVCWSGWKAMQMTHPTATAVAHLPVWLVGLLAVEIVAFPAIEQTENLTPFATHAAADIRGSDTYFFCADETTRAVLDSAANVRLKNVCGDDQVRELLASNPKRMFLAQNAVTRLSSHSQAVLEYLHATTFVRAGSKVMPAQALEALGLRPRIEWSTSGGRSYGLYALPPATLAER